MELVLDIVIDAAKDTLALVPFLFVTFALLAVFEFAAGDKIRSAIQRAGAALVGKRPIRFCHSGLDPESDHRECRASGAHLDSGTPRALPSGRLRRNDVAIHYFQHDCLPVSTCREMTF